MVRKPLLVSVLRSNACVESPTLTLTLTLVLLGPRHDTWERAHQPLSPFLSLFVTDGLRQIRSRPSQLTSPEVSLES